MEFYDWVLFFHVLSAFVLVGALTSLWGLVLATRAPSPMLGPDEALRYGRIGGPLIGVGAMGTIIFGIWLALDHDDYGIFDGWVIGAIVLWFVATASGGQAGRLFESDPVGNRARGIQLQAFNTVLVLIILILMIWKPGA